MQRDSAIFELIEQENGVNRKGWSLLGERIVVSQQVMDAMGSVFTNKYAEGLPGKWYYGGCDIVEMVENLAIERVKKLFKAVWQSFNCIGVRKQMQLLCLDV